jgi:nicotinamidase-related amidase
MKILVVVDMQNDFITGPLGSADAEAIVPAVKARVSDYLCQNDTMVIFTRDTHYPESYGSMIEGQKLPVPHCMRDTEGWEVVPELMKEIPGNETRVRFINKTHFGSLSLVEFMNTFNNIEYVEVCGVCTDICVVSNALLLKASSKDFPVLVNAKLCAGTTKENHEAALLTMKNCQVDVEGV